MAPRPVAVLTAVAVACSPLAGGCGGSAAPRVASIGTAPATSTTATTPAAKLAEFYGCMTSHGFPDYRLPTLVKGQGAGGTKIKLAPAQVAEAQSPGFQAADRKCAPLLPGFGSGLTPAHEAVARAQALKFSRCAR